MTETGRCSQCGAELTDESPQGMCPACLLKLGLSGAVPAYQEPPPPPSMPRHDWVWLAGAALLVIAGFVALLLRGSAPALPVVRFSLSLPENAEFALSPDGRQLAYSAMGRLWIRSLDAFDAREIPGTEGAAFPFWSPDSRRLGYASNGKLQTLDVGGGPPQKICDAPRFHGGSWNQDGVILFADGPLLYRVAASGGMPQHITQLDPSKEIVHRDPRFLPSGRQFLFTAVARQPENSAIYIGDLERGARRLLVAGASSAGYAGSYLLTTRSGALSAYSFDPIAGTVQGDPRLIQFADQVSAFSATGNVLVYRTGAAAQSRLLWFDRSGKGIGRLEETVDPGPMSLSPDGKTVALIRRGGVWLLDPERQTSMRLTLGTNDEATSAVWSPDGVHVAFGTSQGLFQKPANGSGEPELVLRTHGPARADSWSPDGRVLLYDTQEADGKSVIWQLSLSGSDRKPSVLAGGSFEMGAARFSPDGRWIAYVSKETGREEVYVASFPPGSKWAVSAMGGTEPQWRADSKELYFLSAERRVMSVSVAADSRSFVSGMPRLLFSSGPAQYYAATPDGRKFLLQAPPEESGSGSVSVALGWTEDLRK